MAEKDEQCPECRMWKRPHLVDHLPWDAAKTLMPKSEIDRRMTQICTVSDGEGQALRQMIVLRRLLVEIIAAEALDDVDALREIVRKTRQHIPEAQDA